MLAPSAHLRGDVVVADLVHEALRAATVFADTSPAMVSQLGEQCRLRGYGRGDYVFREGDIGDSLFIVVEGQVKLQVSSQDGDIAVITTATAPDCFGELAFLDGGPRSTSARALTDLMLVEIPRPSLLALVREEPKVLDTLLHILGGRLRRLTEQIADATFLDVGGRLAKLLLTLANAQSGAPTAASADLALTQTDLANMVGGTRQTVNRILSDLDQRGVIHLDGKVLIIRRPDVLRRRAGMPARST
jgi:CRP/FNR family transcriptional regulator, cyclic AMP receptor protein